MAAETQVSKLKLVDQPGMGVVEPDSGIQVAKGILLQEVLVEHNKWEQLHSLKMEGDDAFHKQLMDIWSLGQNLWPSQLLQEAALCTRTAELPILADPDGWVAIRKGWQPPSQLQGEIVEELDLAEEPHCLQSAAEALTSW